jgi:hypothetical protein
MTTKLSCHKLSEAHITECEIASLAKKDTTEILNKKLQAMQHNNILHYFKLVIKFQN